MTFSKILIIIQRSNGDVLLSSSLIQNLAKYYNPTFIDLLVNDDTIAIAKMLPNIRNIYTFSYKEKKEHRIKQEVNIIKKIYKNYDLSINLTSSDRSVLYAILASKYSISAIENNNKKSWWKKILLNNYYIFDVKGERGGHRHKRAVQALICLSGSCEVFVNNGEKKNNFILNKPNKCLIIETQDWHTMSCFSNTATLLVLASEYYDVNDYIDEPYYD